MGVTRKLVGADCLDVFDQGQIDTASVDLIYLDPPFNSQQVYNLPFEKLGKDSAAVEAFKDIWHWDERTYDLYGRLGEDVPALRDYIDSIRTLRGESRDSLSAYLVNMAARLHAMKGVLKSTGSIYLHCDPTASHYLKGIMDGVFGHGNFRNEIIWCYSGPSAAKNHFPRKHDNILFYSKSDCWTFNPDEVRIPYTRLNTQISGGGIGGDMDRDRVRRYMDAGKIPESWWEGISPVGRIKSERLGYPTQKPLALLERIIQASSNGGDVLLDPFCGCGTAIHAAEKMRRQWIGIDISRFAIGVVKNRMLESFERLDNRITQAGVPTDISTAKELAGDDPFEFEKWACGQIGAKGLYKNPGSKGADGGIDGVLEFLPDKNQPAYAIVQVKGGRVRPNDVKALFADVDREPKAAAGVLVCFEEYKRTFEHHRSRKKFQDNIAGNEWPMIQLVTIEELLAGKQPHLPNVVTRQGFQTQRDQRQMAFATG